MYKIDLAPKFLSVLLIIGIACGPIVLWAGVVFQSYQLALDIASNDQRRVIESLFQHTTNLLQTQALVLNFTDLQAGERDCSALKSDENIQEFLAVVTQPPAQTEPVRIIDAKGNVCLRSNQAITDTLTRRFRDYFSGARNAGAGRYYVGRARMGAVSGITVFNVAKARMANGAFNGIVVIAINVSSMMNAWIHMFDLKPTQRLALYRINGAVISQSWQPFIPEPDAATEQHTATIWQDAPQGSGVGPSMTDATQRIHAWRILPEWGLVITSSVDKAEVLRPWRRSMAIYGTLAALASTLSALLAWSLLRGKRLLAQTVTQRTKALHASEDRLRLFINGAPAGIALFDTEMRYLAVSQRYLLDRRLPFTSVESLVGRSHFEVSAVFERGREVYRRALAGEILSGENDSYTCVDGHVDWICWDVAPWYELDMTIGGVVLFYEVVTARKQVEIVLSRSKEELEQLVSQRTGELAHTQARLAHAQRMEALGQLAGGIAHDFNNVLQAVLGAAALMAHRPEDQDRVSTLAHRIMESAKRGRAVTSRLLSFSRQSSLQAESLAIRPFLEGIQDILTSTLSAAIVVKVEADPSLPLLFADRRQLETVLINLAINARDAMPNNGTLVFIATLEISNNGSHKDAPLGLEYGSYIRLSVRDTGSGMLPDILGRASEPFFTTKKSTGGTGLGLAMARGFAEQSGGGFDITSVSGEGTTVHLWFPLAEGSLISVDDPAPYHAPYACVTGMPACLLIVDDNIPVLEILAQELEEKGYTVLTAIDGIEALKLLDNSPSVDLIVSDYSMPGMNGVTLIHEAQLRRPLLPAILLTGFVESMAQIAVAKPDISRFTLLQKPISVISLINDINRLLLDRSINTKFIGSLNQ